MSETVIEINNLGKQYRLGQVGTSTMSDDLKRLFYKVRGKEDPFLQVGEVNDRTTKSNSNYVWALKNINFKVERGEVLGIIGKNGAGKSTLLKILSRTTLPTLGEYKIKGRIASLLEVGTGFHPDLTGRENIFLNGAILGMTKSEIKKQFDEIIDFSGVERYIDTPVKRYSSGMYVRLAFAVAAHLDPDILIIDEVLAVGDTEFQKKCLGKMKSVSSQGRTVLFVSHSLPSVRALCTKALYLKQGTVVSHGETSKIIDDYLLEDKVHMEGEAIPADSSTYCNGDAKFTHFRLLNCKGDSIDTLYFEQKFIVELAVQINRPIKKTIIDFSLGSFDTRFTYSSTFDSNGYLEMQPGRYLLQVELSPVILPGAYTFYIGIHDFHEGTSTLDFVEKLSMVNVLPFKENSEEKFPLGVSLGSVRIDGHWNIKPL